MVDLTPFKAGIDAAIKQAPILCDDPRSAFVDVLHGHGLTVPRQIKIDVIDRIDGAEDRRGKGSAWYVYHEFEVEGGVIGVAEFGDWKTGLRDSWQSQSEYRMSDTERSAFLAARELMAQQRELEEIQRHEEAAKKAHEIWHNAEPANDEHPYLKTKGVKAQQHIRVSDKNDLIIPAANADNQIVSLQFIKPDGSKRFLTGGKMKGAYCFFEGNEGTVYIAEGFSTAASVHEATSHITYIAFNAGNLYEVASMVKEKRPDARIIIAGDDDFKNKTNEGKIKAEQAASGLNLECIFPNGTVDFNDMHKDQGIDALKAWLNPDKREAYKAPIAIEDVDFRKPKGVIGSVFDYYNTTSGNKQTGFATQAAIAFTSTILSRRYTTNFNNYPNLYMINVGRSATGKEHAKKMLETLLHKTGFGDLIGGDGYTSAGAVMSTLINKPNHLVCVDEFGRYLEASNNKAGGLHQREANTKIMEAFGRPDGIMRPMNYSTMTKKDADTMANRFVHNPAITMLGITTPATFFKSISIDAVQDGFVNRFLISISSTERSLREHKEPVEVPDSIKQWAKAVTARHGKKHLPMEEASPIVVPFESSAVEIHKEFEQECLDRADKLEQFGMAELVLRCSEISMRLSLNVALGIDPYAQSISKDCAEWSTWYVRKCMHETIGKLKLTISHSDFEADKKEILADLRKRGEKGITKSAMNKTPPYSKFKAKDLLEILNALKEAELAFDEAVKTKGRPSVKWTALN